ncbi:MAG: hypothetical protein ACRD5R_10290, partial [Candidatus Acidiferrales bacterium]
KKPAGIVCQRADECCYRLLASHTAAGTERVVMMVLPGNVCPQIHDANETNRRRPICQEFASSENWMESIHISEASAGVE